MKNQTKKYNLFRNGNETNNYLKIYGFWCDCNTGIRLFGAIYYITDHQRENNSFAALKDKILETKNQYFEMIFAESLHLPYKPANTICFRGKQ